MQEPSAAGECLRSLVLLSQIGLSIVLPPVLVLYGAHWLQNRFELGGWIMVVGLIVGILGAFNGAYRSYLLIKKLDRPKDK